MPPAAQPVKRAPTTRAATRSTATARTTRTAVESGTAVNGKVDKLKDGDARASSSTVAGRKRTALGDLTNANKERNGTTASSSAAPDKAKVATGSSTTTAATRRVATSSTAAARRATATRSGPSASSRATSTASSAKRLTEEEGRAQKRPRKNAPANGIETLKSAAIAMMEETRRAEEPWAHPTAKDEGWEDLDIEDADDPLMVAEYVNEIFVYMKKLELDYMPSADYLGAQRDLDWKMRGVLVDWLIDTHQKFRLLPETLFLTLNIVDRFLSKRMISLAKLQLVGLTAMFVAAKYEEVLCPSVGNFIYVAEGGYTDEEILRAERYMLKILNFNLSYANPMNFLRRISKADNYDIQTRTVAKYFMEVSLVDHRLLDHPPSLIAAASVWLARKALLRGDWNATLVHYASYSQQELLGTAEIMLDYCLRPTIHPSFYKKYSSKKFMRASSYVANWARTTWPQAAENCLPLNELPEDDDGEMLVDLFEHEGLDRLTLTPVAIATAGIVGVPGGISASASRASTVEATQLLDCSRDFDNASDEEAEEEENEDDEDEEV